MDKFPKEYETTTTIESSDRVINYMREEFRGFKEFFFEALRDKIWIHSPPYLRKNVVEKPLQLKIAKNIGLRVPLTWSSPL